MLLHQRLLLLVLGLAQDDRGGRIARGELKQARKRKEGRASAPDVSSTPWLGRVITEQHIKLGSVIQSDAGVIIDRWSRRAIAEHPKAKRVHHDTLLDHLPTFLQKLGQSLAESSDTEASQHCRSARQHGEQRWEKGWSIAEVVEDYQILRLVLVEYLEEALERALRSREIMAIGLALDEAIGASVNAYAHENAEHAKKADETLRQQATALKEADRRKDEFLAVLAHELRNPLAPLRNAVHVLGFKSSDPATVEWVRGMFDRQIQRMTRLVDDLLDISRIPRGKVTLRQERLDLARLVREAAEDRRGNLTEAGLTLELELANRDHRIV